MPTLDLEKAAKLLHMHPITVQTKARSGEIPGAKPGKCWVFIEEDLIEWLRSQYNANRQEVSKEGKCLSKEKIAPIGISSLRSMDERYIEALAPKTKKKPKP